MHYNQYQPWTAEDLQLLQELAARDMPKARLCRILGRSPGAIDRALQLIMTRQCLRYDPEIVADVYGQDPDEMYDALAPCKYDIPLEACKDAESCCSHTDDDRVFGNSAYAWVFGIFLVGSMYYMDVALKSWTSLGTHQG